MGKKRESSRESTPQKQEQIPPEKKALSAPRTSISKKQDSFKRTAGLLSENDSPALPRQQPDKKGVSKRRSRSRENTPQKQGEATIDSKMLQAEGKSSLPLSNSTTKKKDGTKKLDLQENEALEKPSGKTKGEQKKAWKANTPKNVLPQKRCNTPDSRQSPSRKISKKMTEDFREPPIPVQEGSVSKKSPTTVAQGRQSPLIKKNLSKSQSSSGNTSKISSSPKNSVKKTSGTVVRKLTTSKGSLQKKIGSVNIPEKGTFKGSSKIKKSAKDAKAKQKETTSSDKTQPRNINTISVLEKNVHVATTPKTAGVNSSVMLRRSRSRSKSPRGLLGNMANVTDSAENVDSSRNSTERLTPVKKQNKKIAQNNNNTEEMSSGVGKNGNKLQPSKKKGKMISSKQGIKTEASLTAGKKIKGKGSQNNTNTVKTDGTSESAVTSQESGHMQMEEADDTDVRLEEEFVTPGKVKDSRGKSKITPIKRIDGGVLFICPVCQEELVSESELTSHIRHSHNSPGAASKNCSRACLVCGKVLSSQSSLDRHSLVHSGERPHKCHLCQQGFTTRGNLKRHLKTHQDAPDSQNLPHSEQADREKLTTAKETFPKTIFSLKQKDSPPNLKKGKTDRLTQKDKKEQPEGGASMQEKPETQVGIGSEIIKSHNKTLTQESSKPSTKKSKNSGQLLTSAIRKSTSLNKILDKSQPNASKKMKMKKTMNLLGKVKNVTSPLLKANRKPKMTKPKSTSPSSTSVLGKTAKVVKVKRKTEKQSMKNADNRKRSSPRIQTIKSELDDDSTPNVTNSETSSVAGEATSSSEQSTSVSAYLKAVMPLRKSPRVPKYTSFTEFAYFPKPRRVGVTRKEREDKASKQVKKVLVTAQLESVADVTSLKKVRRLSAPGPALLKKAVRAASTAKSSKTTRAKAGRETTPVEESQESSTPSKLSEVDDSSRGSTSSSLKRGSSLERDVQSGKKRRVSFEGVILPQIKRYGILEGSVPLVSPSKRQLERLASALSESEAKRRLEMQDVRQTQITNNLLHCGVCGKTFLSTFGLLTHLESHPNYAIRCKTCNLVFMNPRGLTMHKRMVHNKSKMGLEEFGAHGIKPADIPVGFFDLSFAEFSTQKFPLVAKAWCEENTRISSSAFHDFTCKFCKKSFPCASSFELHNQTHTEKTRSKCNYCGTDVETHVALLIHELKHKDAACDKIGLNGVSTGGANKDQISVNHDNSCVNVHVVILDQDTTGQKTGNERGDENTTTCHSSTICDINITSECVSSDTESSTDIDTEKAITATNSSLGTPTLNSKCEDDKLAKESGKSGRDTCSKSCHNIAENVTDKESCQVPKKDSNSDSNGDDKNSDDDTAQMTSLDSEKENDSGKLNMAISNCSTGGDDVIEEEENVGNSAKTNNTLLQQGQDASNSEDLFRKGCSNDNVSAEQEGYSSADDFYKECFMATLELNSSSLEYDRVEVDKDTYHTTRSDFGISGYYHSLDQLDMADIKAMEADLSGLPRENSRGNGKVDVVDTSEESQDSYDFAEVQDVIRTAVTATAGLPRLSPSPAPLEPPRSPPPEMPTLRPMTFEPPPRLKPVSRSFPPHLRRIPEPETIPEVDSSYPAESQKDPPTDSPALPTPADSPTPQAAPTSPILQSPPHSPSPQSPSTSPSVHSPPNSPTPPSLSPSPPNVSPSTGASLAPSAHGGSTSPRPHPAVNTDAIVMPVLVSFNNPFLSGQLGGHLVRMRIPCGQCAAVLDSPKELEYHIAKSHDGATPYKCKICNYSSIDKSTLMRHLRSHSGERPYQCLICLLAFTTKANCERHIRNKHRIESKLEIENKIGYNQEMAQKAAMSDAFHSPDTICKTCGTDFKFFRDLNNHLRTSDCAQKPFLCGVCNSGFSNKANCLRHLQNVHLDVRGELDVDRYVICTGMATPKRIGSDFGGKVEDLPPPPPLKPRPGLVPVVSPFQQYWMYPPLDQSNPSNWTPAPSVDSSTEAVSREPIDANSRGLEEKYPGKISPPSSEDSQSVFPGEQMQDSGHVYLGSCEEENSHETQVSSAERDTSNDELSEKTFDENLQHSAWSSASPVRLDFKNCLKSSSAVSSAHENIDQSVTRKRSRKSVAPKKRPVFAVDFQTSLESERDSDDGTEPVVDRELEQASEESPSKMLRTSTEVQDPEVGCEIYAHHQKSIEDNIQEKPNPDLSLMPPSSSQSPKYGLIDASQSPSMQNITDPSRPYICPYCNRGFPWASALQRHLYSHTGQKPFPCHKCDMSFSTKSNRERHLLRKHGMDNQDPAVRQNYDRPYKCHLCVFSTFSSMDKMTKHFKEKHPGCSFPDLKKILYQPITDQQSIKLENFHQSEGLSHANFGQSIQSDDPGLRGFENRDISHIGLVNLDGMESNAGSAEEQMDSFHQSEQFLHGDLGQSSDLKHGHFEEQACMCSRCPCVFESRLLLAKHIRDKHTELPFRCHVHQCDLSFDSRRECLEHLQSTHPTEWLGLLKLNRLSDIGDFMSNLTGKESTSAPSSDKEGNGEREEEGGAMENHLRKVNCSLCFRKFWSIQDLRRHMRSHTGEKPFSCSYCGRRFSLKHSMMRHKKTHQAEGEQGSQIGEQGGQGAETDIQQHHTENQSESCEEESEEDNSMLLQNLLGVEQTDIDHMLTSADDAAKLLGVNSSGNNRN